METFKLKSGNSKLVFLTTMIAFGLLAVSTRHAAALTLTLLDGNGNAVSGGYRWLVEEDKTYHVQLNNDGTIKTEPDLSNPGRTKPVIDPNWDQVNTLSVSFHRSYMPVVAQGTDADIDALVLDSSKNYFISVLPNAPYSLSGAQIKPGQTAVTVHVNSQPTPTAQISVFVHEDIAPINNVWDDGEQGLAGFTISLEDAGGKYGASAGIQSTDVYGNPLCTSYQYNADGLPILDPDGLPVIDVLGAGCTSGPDGRVTIKNLAPGKFGVSVIPPAGSIWKQTSTIEGKPVIDAWVKANEPPFFSEFGPPGPHVEFGFVPANDTHDYIDVTVLNGGETISGDVVNMHLSRPPETTFYEGGPFPHTTPWVGLNEMAGGVVGRGIYAARTVGGHFEIKNVPPGQYQLVVWDDNLDLLFAQSTVNVKATGGCNELADCNLGNVGVFQWFSRLENFVFLDSNGNALYDEGEGIPEQNVNLRFRDGTIYQAFPTDSEGFVPFDEVFPFFSWLVAEVDFARFKATGLTVTVDDGGPVPFGDPWSFGDQLNPQPQGFPNDPDSIIVDAVSRTEVGPVLTQGFQGFLGQTSVLQWSKEAYGPGENGGISGVVMYAVTRAEDNPELAAAEPWEPGIPNVTVNLYQADANGNKIGVDPIRSTTTDSWDDSLPANCQYGSTGGAYIFRNEPTDCYDGMRNWNQVRPGVFDGGYAFGPEFTLADDFPGLDAFPDWIVPSAADASIGYLKPGRYIVEVIPPAGYEIIKYQDKNVDFGEQYVPAPQLLPPQCVGADYLVPPELSLFPGIPAAQAGTYQPLCDQKLVSLSNGQNAAADFFMFTQVPISGHIIGFILDDTANEYDPTSPQFGEKYAPPFLPVSIRDYTGREIARTVSDEYGVYNALVPATFTQNLPKPSGMSASMLTTCMNAKTLPNGQPDPLHNPQYSQFCYTLQYVPGSTTYLDTPVVPVAAFAGADQNPLDCEQPTETPAIASVSVSGNGVSGGPYVPANNSGQVAGNHVVTITSMGQQLVPNPAYDGNGGTEPKTIWRDYGFGPDQGGTIIIEDLHADPQQSWTLTPLTWSENEITFQITAGSSFGDVGAKQLSVIRGDNNAKTVVGVSLQVGLRNGATVRQVLPGGSIQNAINTARNNDLILVAPGVYDEMVIMWKPVQLQGWGAGSTTIDAIKQPSEKLVAWRSLAESLVNSGSVDLIDGQGLGFGGIEPTTFFSEEGAGILVAAENGVFRSPRNRNARIDGFTITSADTGGGVVVNGFGEYLELSNLNVTNNSAFYAGGIRVGHPLVIANDQESDALNNYIMIHHNDVSENGGLDGAGGGIALHTGSDSYKVTDNFVCGNFTGASGAGIAHYGLSDRNRRGDDVPLIARNTILFNETFNQGLPANGGGIMVAGKPSQVAGTLSLGSGSVDIIGNLVQGNSSGSGDGAGIHLSRINGSDAFSPNGQMRPVSRHHVINIENNMVVNNVAALAGGGISMQDALHVSIIHNTIARNNNTSTAGAAFSPGLPTSSTRQHGAGLVSYGHLDIPSSATGGYSQPAALAHNIIMENRSFNWILDTSNPDFSIGRLLPDIGAGDAPDFSDLAVIGAAGSLTCDTCILSTDGVNPDSLFAAPFWTGNRETVGDNVEINTSIQAPPALDEGGNFIRLRYGPLTPSGDYHILAGSAAHDQLPADADVTDDFDLETRTGSFDIGADEIL